jgi:hypothetical protein
VSAPPTVGASSLPPQGAAPESRALSVAGRQLVGMLHSAVRAVHLYPGENRAVQNAVAELGEAAERVVQSDGEAELRLVADLCFLDDVRLRIDPVSHAAFAGIAEVMRRHGIGRFRIAAGATTAEWLAAIRLLGAEAPAEDRFEAIAERWASAGIQRLGIAPMSEHELLRREAEAPADTARRTYQHSVAAARQAMESVRMGRGGGFRGVKRAVQSIVDQVLNNETSILGMTVLRDHDEYTFRHSVNVCIFSIALGRSSGSTARSSTSWARERCCTTSASSACRRR